MRDRSRSWIVKSSIKFNAVFNGLVLLWRTVNLGRREKAIK